MDKATMYVRSEFGMGVKKVEVTRLTVEVKPYAQYERGIHATFLPKRMRKLRGLTQAYGPSLVVLEGWGHPDPDGMWDPATLKSDGEVTTQRARYSACDPRWQSDFDAMLEGYVERSGAKVLYDFRKHEPGCRGMIGTCSCFSCSKARDAEVADLLASFEPPPELPEHVGAEV